LGAAVCRSLEAMLARVWPAMARGVESIMRSEVQRMKSGRESQVTEV
jgi:hypothetical protein